MFSYTFCNILFHGFSLKQFCATDSEQINEANKKITVYKKTDEWDICRCNAVYTRLTFYKRSNFEYILKYCLQLPLEQWNDVFGQSFISTPYFPKKESLTKMANRCNSLSLVVTRCLSLFLLLPLVVSLVATRCHLLYHYDVSRYTTCCHHFKSIYHSYLSLRRRSCYKGMLKS